MTVNYEMSNEFFNFENSIFQKQEFIEVSKNAFPNFFVESVESGQDVRTILIFLMNEVVYAYFHLDVNEVVTSK